MNDTKESRINEVETDKGNAFTMATRGCREFRDSAARSQKLKAV